LPDGRLALRRIPNLADRCPDSQLGIAVSSIANGWQGTKESLLGAGLGLGLLLPFVLLRSWEREIGSWPAPSAHGVGPQQLITILMGTVLLAGLMALVLVIWKKRVRQTLHNFMAHTRIYFYFSSAGAGSFARQSAIAESTVWRGPGSGCGLVHAGQAWVIIFSET